MNRKPQIAVIGSSDNLSNTNIETAKNLGIELSKHDVVLLFSFEGDRASLPELTAREFINNGGNAIAFVWHGAKEITVPCASILTAQDRGGGREFPLIRSSDAVISMSGGSGTLMEIAMAYQARIPVVAISTTGSWSKRLARTFLDDRKAMIVHEAKTVKEAVVKAMALARKKLL